MKKIKVLKTKYRNCSFSSDEVTRGITKWDEVSDEEYCKLVKAIFDANNRLKKEEFYFLVEEVTDNQEIFDKAQDFIDYQKKEAEKDRINLERLEKERKKKKLERKKKQFEKLKKELGAK